MLSHIELTHACIPNRRTFSVENRTKQRPREENSITHMHEMHECEFVNVIYELEFETSISNDHLTPHF